MVEPIWLEIQNIEHEGSYSMRGIASGVPSDAAARSWTSEEHRIWSTSR